MFIGKFPESSSRQISVGIILAGRFGVTLAKRALFLSVGLRELSCKGFRQREQGEEMPIPTPKFAEHSDCSHKSVHTVSETPMAM